MDKKLKQVAMGRIRTVETLLRQWDPIGVFSVEGGPKDEYDSYAPHIVSMLQSGCSVAHLAVHLSHLRTEVIGMPNNEESDRRAAENIINTLQKQV